MKRTHEVRVGTSVYRAETWPEIVDEAKGHGWSAIDGRLAGWAPGTRADALNEAREGLLARETLRRLSGLGAA